MFKPVVSLVTVAVIAALNPSLSYADQKKDIEVIEVTSNFRQQNLMTVDGSISVIGSDEIVKRGAAHSENLLGALANVNFSSGASRGNYIQIRGIGLRSQFVDPVNPSVGLIIDGINYSGLGGASMLFDVDSYALYRGPQGTQFGNDALAGLIKIDSVAAAADQESRLLLSVGDYNSHRYGIATGTSFGDDVHVRLSAVSQVTDGYITNKHLNVKDTNNIDESNVKLKLNWQATDDLSFDAVMHYIDVDNGYDSFSLDLNRDTLSDQPGRDTQLTKAFGLTTRYQGFDFANVEIILSSLQSDLIYSYDEDWSYVGIPGWGYSWKDIYNRERQQSSADLRLLSKGKSLFNQKASWVAGLYLNQRDSDLARVHTKAKYDVSSVNEHRDIAVYGQIEYDLSEQTVLTVGARVGQYDIEYFDTRLTDQVVSDNLYGFNLSLNHQLNKQAMIYLALTRSDKAGGVNAQALANPDTFASEVYRQQLLANSSFAPETLYSLEYGVKGRSLDDSLTIKMAAFYNYRQDPQLKSTITDKDDNASPVFVDFIDNAGSGRGYGLELEADYQATDSISLFLTAGYLQTTI
ncbi:MAG: TonB-dependent receptor, partial [Gammaproteobacteria bacterium]|nr:TonB-dependent receptor [Gammaproteobacteria bacterium]